jgi:protein gp37
MIEKNRRRFYEYSWNPWYGHGVVTVSKTFFKQPLLLSQPLLVLVCRHTCFFCPQSDEWRTKAWKIIKATPQLQYQIITRQPDRIKACLPPNWGNTGRNNIWLGVGATTEEETYYRVKELLKVPARVRFLSAEPLKENIVSARTAPLLKELDWVTVSGHASYKLSDICFPIDVAWPSDIAELCKQSGIPLFVKQLGNEFSKKMGYRDPYGFDITEWPEQLQVRKLPQYYYDYIKLSSPPIQLKLL